MIAGLHWTAWLLATAAVGGGLCIELYAFLGHRRRMLKRRQADEVG